MFKKYGFLIFFIAAILYFELIYKLWIFKIINTDYFFSVLFALPVGGVIFLISHLFPEIINKIIAFLATLFLSFLFFLQFIYYDVFNIPFSFYATMRVGYAFQFWRFVLSVIIKNIPLLLISLIPIAVLFLLRRKILFSRLSYRPMLVVLIFGLICSAVFLFSIYLTKTDNFSQYVLYYKMTSPELSVRKLGVLPTIYLDFKRLAFGFDEDISAEISGAQTSPVESSNESDISSNTYNMMNIDFNNLIANEKDSNLLEMHKYFSSVVPTKKNQYTGIFKGQNFIFFVAESFSPYAISPELTPTLYKMSKEGFVFNDFYNPIWEVSTSDGEYVSDTGLIPKSGVWSMLKSAKNYLPFTLGNQFRKIGYVAKAYHDHTYTYYNRNISIPNLGYDYKGVGSGVNVKKTWPESDLEMIENTTDEYLNSSSSQPFHIYYLTVSGHLEYNFYGNYIAKKNKSFVENLPYTDSAKAYIAANMELEFAVKRLIEKLDAAGVLDNTVIAIISDHYPYGLSRQAMDELAGHKVEDNFELYKSIFILWKNKMEPFQIDEPVSNLDILPTLSNLFGLEYDSRLLMGRDIFSDASPLVVFLNHSWITNENKYNSTKDAPVDKKIDALIASKFNYSRKILETDYYKKIFQ